MASSDQEQLASGVSSQPGNVITPGSSSQPAPVPPAPASQTAPEPQPQSVQPSPYATADQQDMSDERDANSIVWTASEFIAHEKSSGWYLALMGAAVLVVGIVFLLTRDWISSIIVLICAFALGVGASRRPRELQYRLDPNGIFIGSKHFQYEDFRSFAVVPEGAFSSIVFMPLKRFAPLTTIYYAPDDEDDIVTMLADRLPMEEHRADPVDRLMKRIRF